MQPPLANIFQPLINVFDAILKVFHDDIGLGWGLAIIALTVLIRSLLLPLTLKQLRSMYRMAQFTPEIRRLREKHGSDPKRLQQETMAFYKQHRINPLGSLLPALAQLPVFLSLYYMLRTDLRYDICPGINPPGTSNPQPCGETAASHFLFIPDLTSRASGAVLVALIVLYVGSQLVSFLLSANPTMDKTQRMIFMALPLPLHHHRLAAAGRPARVLDHHEHMDDRPGRDRAHAPGSPPPGGTGRAGGRRRTCRAG